jgi:cytochrome c-type biogenesis protein CcmE
MKKKYLVGLIGAVVLVVTAFVMVSGTSIAYVKTFTEAARNGRTVQIAGRWERAGGCAYNPDVNEFRFTMRDTSGALMPVVLDGGKPNNFEIAMQVVATGRVVSDTLRATHVLTKCPSKYEASPKDL